MLQKRVGNYELNSTSFDFDKNKFEAPVERAKEAATIIRHKSSTYDLHVTLRVYYETPSCGVGNECVANERVLFDVTSRA